MHPERWTFDWFYNRQAPERMAMSNHMAAMADSQIEGAISENEALRLEVEQLRAALAGLLDAHARNVLFGGGDHWEHARKALGA